MSEIKNNGLLAELKRVEKRVEELEKSESILSEEKESLENLISNSLDCIIQSDAKGVVTGINKAFVGMSGFDKEDIIGKTANFRRLLQERSYTTCEGDHEVDVFRKDLVITDLAMPGMKGWQVAKEIKKIDKNMPIILTTGWELMLSEEVFDKKC